jgi:hypothetical protein
VQRRLRGRDQIGARFGGKKQKAYLFRAEGTFTASCVPGNDGRCVHRFGMFSEFRFMSAYLIAFGVVMLVGAGFSVLNSRRIARMEPSERG